MVRVYVRKTDRGNAYSKETLTNAVKDIKSGKISVKKASKTFKIPYSSLLHHVRGTRGLKSTSFGRSTVFSEEAEETLAKGIKTLDKWGWGLGRKEILELVGKYVTINNVKTPFKDGHPGEDWFLRFKKKHRLSIKKPEKLEISRKKVADPFILNKYFDLLKETLENLQLINKPKQIYNIDETSFCLDPGKTKVVGEVNSPSCRVTSGPGREYTTVLLGGNANGDKLPPLIVFKAKNVWDQWMADEKDSFPNTSYAATANGWMETEVFNKYFEHSFLEHCGQDRPILLIYDGHATHLDSKIVELAVENQITILKLPPHSSHLLQPMDLSVFGSLKTNWDSKLTKWQRNHIGVKIPKKEFSSLVGKIWVETKCDTIENGFKKGGVYPFNRGVLEKIAFDPLAKKRYEEQKEKEEANKEEENHPDLKTNSTDEALSQDGFAITQDDSAVLQAPDEVMNQPSTSKHENKILTNISFEELLLETVRQAPSQVKKKKRKVCGSAQVITLESIKNTPTQIKQDKSKRYQEKDGTKKVKTEINQGKHHNKSNNNCSKIDLTTIKQENSSKKQKNTKKRFRLTDSSSESDLEINILSDEDNETEEDFKKRIIHENEEILKENFKEDKEENDLHDWILVKFPIEKKKGPLGPVYFVGQIIDMTNEEPLVKFTKIKDSSRSTSIFLWREPEDISLVKKEDIVMTLSEPTPGRRGELIFPLSFKNFNIQ